MGMLRSPAEQFPNGPASAPRSTVLLRVDPWTPSASLTVPTDAVPGGAQSFPARAARWESPLAKMTFRRPAVRKEIKKPATTPRAAEGYYGSRAASGGAAQCEGADCLTPGMVVWVPAPAHANGDAAAEGMTMPPPMPLYPPAPALPVTGAPPMMPAPALMPAPLVPGPIAPGMMPMPMPPPMALMPVQDASKQQR